MYAQKRPSSRKLTFLLAKPICKSPRKEQYQQQKLFSREWVNSAEKQEQLFEGGEEETEKEKQPTHQQSQVNSVEKGEQLFGGGEEEEKKEKK